MPFRILSLDGGGIRGLFQAVYLSELSKRLPKNIHECFDMIAGTSTGSIVTMGLVNGIDPARIADMFRSDGPKIFKKPMRVPIIGSALHSGSKYKTEPLESALRRILGNKLVSDALCHFVVPAVTLNTYRCKVFSNAYGSKTDDELLAVDVALASSAAPTYFSSVTPSGSNRSFVDGGLFANDPSFVAAMVAHQELDVPFSDMRFLRLGNGRVQSGLTPDEYDNLTELNTIGPLFEMMFESQGTWIDAVLAALCSGEHLVRVNPELAEFVELDDPAAAISRLPARAEEEARETTERVKRLLGIQTNGGGGGGWEGMCEAPVGDF